MRNIYTYLLVMLIALYGNAQDLAKKIPSNANVVVTLKGKNVMELVSLAEFSNSKLGMQITKELQKETKEELNAIEELGINLKQNHYYFLETKKGVFYNNFLFSFKNTENITRLLRREQDKIKTEGNLSYIQEEYGGTVLIWNNSMVVMVLPSNQNKNYDDDYGFYDVEPYIPPVVAEEAVKESAEAVEEIAESKPEEVVVEEAEETVSNYYDSDAYKKQQEEREKRRKERRAKREEAKKAQNIVTLAYAKKLMAGNQKSNILQNNDYKKSLGKGKDEVMVWANNFMDLYKNTLPSKLFGTANPYEFLNIDELYKDMTIVGRLNFEEDNVVMGIDYTMNDKMANAYKPMYNGKFNKNFLDYINEDKLLGYMSLNMSTQGVLEAYPELIETMFSGKKTGKDSKTEAIAAVTSSVSRLFSLLIDEEGAAKILRGDMLLLLTDLREKEVTYTDYEYDEDYNYKKIEKTKTETVPDFLFLVTSEEEKMFRNFMKIGVSENKVDYNNGIYTIPSSRSNPFDVYLMHFDNTLFVGSSLEHLTQIKNGTYPSKLSSNLRKDIAKSAMSFYVNGKNIVSKIPSEAFPRGLRSNIDFLTNNTRDLKVSFSKIKGNKMSGQLELNTPAEGHKNSLMYFINVIDQLMK